MKTSTIISALILATLIACTGNTADNRNTDNASDSNNHATEQLLDNKHSVEYISQRLNYIYSKALNINDHDLLALDSMFMSKEYNELQNKAMKIAERNHQIVIDADHWIQGQDWTNPTMKIINIENISDNEATANVNITTNINNEKTVNQLVLHMVFEQGEWFIDNMQQYYEGELLDEKDWYRKYVDNDGKLTD